MNRQTLADVLQDTNQTGSYTLATVLEGAEAGSQLLLRDGDALWQTQSAGLLQRQLAVLQACTATGFLTLEGQRVFAERFGAVPQLVVCGGGHVAAALVKQAKLLGLPVLAIDDREEFAQQLRAAGADTVLCAPFAQALQNVSGGAETYFAVLTRSHAFDLDCLTQILQKPAAYVGMMGSRGRAALVRRQLLETGLDSQRVESLCAPIGLAIGAQTAAEIALSILAEIVQVKNARPQTEGYPIALLDAMVQAENARTPAVLATIVARHGSTPRDVGAKMLILPDGSTVGSVGGGIMEYYTVQAAQKLLAQAAPFCNACSFRLTAKTRMRPLLPVAVPWRCCCRHFSPGRKQNEKGCLNYRARRRRPCHWNHPPVVERRAAGAGIGNYKTRSHSPSGCPV